MSLQVTKFLLEKCGIVTQNIIVYLFHYKPAVSENMYERYRTRDLKAKALNEAQC